MTLPDTNTLLIGAMAFLRIGGIVFALPVFGDSPTPVRVRMLLSLCLTIGLFPIIPPNWGPNLDVDAIIIGNFILSELVVGLGIGIFARIAFDGLLMAASVVSYQMGFGTSNLFLPDVAGRLDAFTAFHRIFVMLIFLGLNLHHVFISAIADTFMLIPGGGATIYGEMGTGFIEASTGLFLVAIKIAAPIVVALLFTMAALGLIARTVPQMNVFTLSFPASFFIGLAVYLATLPFFPNWITEQFETTQSQIMTFLSGLGRTI